MADQQNDTEITLGTGKLLGLFFMLVILCGIFLGLGYMLGRNSGKQEGLLSGDSTPAGTISGAAKPGASQSTPPKLTVAAPEQVSAGASDSKPAAQGADTQAAVDTKQSPEMQLAPSGGGYVVQVAAVTKKEDADALQQALQHKQYPVVVSSGAADKLFHVQIGPFADVKDAETMKTRLAADGYNAIVKR
jgi:cell division septation protein DedD